MNNRVGKVISLFISTLGEKKRTFKDTITTDSNGVVDDKFYAKDIERSILITTIESYELAKSHNIDIEIGALGENILIDYNPYSLKVGTQLIFGDVILEISQNCTLCKSLTKVDSKLPKLLKNDRGIFAKVIKGGVIKKGDSIYI
ncbi:hypothetical protein MNB_SV-15-46 [hydrothermal vent metagenome]|uniref:MOSC domain-containing protein n=1 Tax=hydrothermal vent metagenome TaxID=652676 RepID=A0A1W1EJE4_9ZZZZ